jgi:hypothetical protein
MKQKSWSSQDIDFAPAASVAGGEGTGTSPADDAAFNALLQSATAVSTGGEGGEPSCWGGLPPYWSRAR